MANPNFPSPFQFNDFVSYFSALSQSTVSGSWRMRDKTWAQWLGYGSRRTVGMVREGRRPPSSDFLLRLGRYLGQNESEQRYLALMAALDTEINAQNQKRISAELGTIRQNFRARRVLSEQEMNYIAHWYSCAIKQMVSAPDFDPNPEIISKRLRGKVSPVEVKRSLENMVRIGVLETVDTPQRYRVRLERVTTPADVPMGALRQHHFEQILRAGEALRDITVQEREFLSVTLTFDPQRMQEAKGVLRQMAEEFDKRFSSGSSQEVFQMCVQFFPHTGGGNHNAN